MSYLVDTNVLSESAKKTPAVKVLAWLRANADSIYVSSVSLGELAYGIERLPPGQRRRNLEAWLQRTAQSLKGRILSFNARSALEWGGGWSLRWNRAGTGCRSPTAKSPPLLGVTD